MSHLPSLITDLALILGIAAITTILFKKLKQPVVLGYILAGLLVEPEINFLPNVQDSNSITVWAEIGIIFLLFNLGLEFSIKKMAQVGPVAAPTGVFEVLTMMVIGYVAGGLLGWPQMDRIFLGGMIAISSTTIIIRAFDELGLKTKKFTGLVLGVLIIEDIVAVLLLVLLSTVAVSQNFEGSELVFSILKLAFFLTLWFLMGILLIPTLLNKLKQYLNDETILVVALGLCLGMVVLANQVGFSSALGAFLMGSILAETTYVEKIEHQLKPIKDLFGAVFFVSVGMMISPALLWENIVPVIVLTIAVLVGKTVCVTVGMLISGQSLKSALQSGMSMSQIGEFSFIIATLGLSLGVISEFIYPIAVGVSVITTFTTPYMIKLSEPAYNRLEKILPASWLDTLNRYSESSQKIVTESDWKILVKGYVRLILINSVMVIGVILLAYYVVLPMETSWVGDSLLNRSVFFLVVLLLILPFLWGLLRKKVQLEIFKGLWDKNRYNRGPLLSLELLRALVAVALLTFLLSKVFSVGIVLGIALLVVFIGISIFSNRIQGYYNKIENRFYTNLNHKEIEEKNRIVKLKGLLPWDTHFAVFHVSASSAVIGKPLSELRLREDYGVNIAIIDRSHYKIYVPGKSEVLFPGDTITVVGDDEQLQSIKEFFETPLPLSKTLSHEEIVLGKIVVRENDQLAGKTIQGSNIRESTHGMVIGLEREEERMLNPESNVVLEDGDILWIVGDKKLIDQVIRKQKEYVVDESR